MTKIEWTEQTWNPIVGCSVVSPGCTNCYAMKLAPKLAANPATPHYAGTVESSRAGPVWTGKVALASDDALTAPLHRRKPTMYFVNSMGDLFHEAVPDEWIDRVFAVMALAPQHTFQVLTKRAARMREYIAHINAHVETRHEIIERKARMMIEDADAWMTESWPLPNVWLGVSAEDQLRLNIRWPNLAATPAAVRFVSAEPLLGPLDFKNIRAPQSMKVADALTGQWDDGIDEGRDASLDWVIVGGESGRGARPMHPDWPREIRDQCAAAGVPFFFKQWGEWSPVWIAEDEVGDLTAAYPLDGCCDDTDAHRSGECRFWQGGDLVHWPLLDASSATQWIGARRIGKAAAGRLLDGREWNGMPGVEATS